MRSDEQIERMLADWLDAEAQPIPHSVLEGALESISHTAQVGGQRRGLGWFGGRPMEMALAGALLVLIAVTAGLAWDRFGFLMPPVPGHGQARVWNPSADWRSGPIAENPSRDAYGNAAVWSYMQSTSTDSHDRTRYVLLPNYEGVDAWNQVGMDGTSPDLHEAWNEPTLINAFVGLAQPEGRDSLLYLHPAVSVILGWTSPLEGEITIQGVVSRPQDPCSVPHGGLVFTIERGSDTFHSDELDIGDEAAFDITADVGVGDIVYFVVDAGADARCALASLLLRITSR
jgi:hypothetical protein